MDEQHNISSALNPIVPPLSSPQPLDYFLGLQSLVNALGSAWTVEGVADTIINHALPIMGTNVGMIVMLSPDGARLEILRQQGFSAEHEAAWKTFSTAPSNPFAVVVKEQRTLMFHDKEEFLAAFPAFATCEGLVNGAVVVIPMVMDKVTIGAIGLSYYQSHTYSVWDITFLETVATQCAQAIERARLHDAHRRDVEQIAQQSANQLLRGIMDSVDESVLALDTDLCLLACNKPLERFVQMRFGKQVVPGMSLFEALVDVPEELELVTGFWRRALAGESFTVIREFNKAPFARRIFEISYSCLRDADGKTIGAIHVSRDITARAQTEQALRKTQARLEEAQRVSRLGSWEYDIATGTNSWSGEMFHILGLDPAQGEPSYMTNLALYHPDDAVRLDACVSRAFTEYVGYKLDVRRTVSGKQRWYHTVGKPVLNDRGELVRLVGTLQDITESKQIEEQLVQAQKMESIGRLAGGIAHDFNNLLAIILGYLELTEDELPADSPLLANFRTMTEAANRAGTLTRQLLSFARRQPIEPKVISPNELIESTSRMLRPLIGENVRLSTDLATEMSRVRVDPNQLEQVLVNIVVNACDAMPQGGTVTIQTREEELTEDQRHPQFVLPCGAYVHLSVSDTGMGIPEEVQSQIFEPFFSTKEFGRGTGLGLATVYGIVKQNDGYIFVESVLGQGTTFHIYLPRVESELTALPAPIASPAILSGNETVLVVEDEQAVRDLVVLTLRQRGYNVLEAWNGVEALRTAQEHTGEIHLLLTDAIMPEMGGKDLAERIRQVRPETRILMASGYSADRFTGAQSFPPGMSFLAKPFTPRELLAKVREVLT